MVNNKSKIQNGKVLQVLVTFNNIILQQPQPFETESCQACVSCCAPLKNLNSKPKFLDPYAGFTFT